MAVLIGIGLVGSHLMFLILVAQICTDIFPGIGLMVFLIAAILSGFAMLHIQTRLEGFFISRHIRKTPNSPWRVIANGEFSDTQQRLGRERVDMMD